MGVAGTFIAAQGLHPVVEGCHEHNMLCLQVMTLLATAESTIALALLLAGILSL